MQVIKQYLSEMSKRNDDRLYSDPVTFLINDHHQFIYLKPGKTAGTSIFVNYLRPFDNKNIFSAKSILKINLEDLQLKYMYIIQQ